MSTLGMLRAVSIAAVLLVMIPSVGVGGRLYAAPAPKVSNDTSALNESAPKLEPAVMEIAPMDPVVAYEQWLEETTSAINAVDAENVMVNNATFTQHELTAIANHIDVNGDSAPDINYIYKLWGARNVTVVGGFSLGLGQDTGWVFASGQQMESGLMWTMLPACLEVEFTDGSVRSVDVEAGSLIAVGMAVCSLNPSGNQGPAVGADTTANWCETTCDPGFWGCCNLEPLSCKCVRNTVRNPSCQSGGEGARTCSAGTRPSNSNREDFSDQPRHRPQTNQ